VNRSELTLDQRLPVEDLRSKYESEQYRGDALEAALLWMAKKGAQVSVETANGKITVHLAVKEGRHVLINTQAVNLRELQYSSLNLLSMTLARMMAAHEETMRNAENNPAEAEQPRPETTGRLPHTVKPDVVVR